MKVVCRTCGGDVTGSEPAERRTMILYDLDDVPYSVDMGPSRAYLPCGHDVPDVVDLDVDTGVAR